MHAYDIFIILWNSDSHRIFLAGPGFTSPVRITETNNGKRELWFFWNWNVGFFCSGSSLHDIAQYRTWTRRMEEKENIIRKIPRRKLIRNWRRWRQNAKRLKRRGRLHPRTRGATTDFYLHKRRRISRHNRPFFLHSLCCPPSSSLLYKDSIIFFHLFSLSFLVAFFFFFFLLNIYFWLLCKSLFTINIKFLAQ